MARRFTNGTSDEIDFGRLGGALDGQSKLTVAFWTKLRSSGTAWTHLVCMMDAGIVGFVVMHGANGSGLYGEIAGAEVTKDSVFTTDAWTHVAVRYDTSLSGDARLELFLDGTKLTGVTRYGTIGANTGTSSANLRIGGTDHEADNRPNDDIEHVAIWRDGLSDEQIKSLANGLNPARLSPYFYAPLFELGSARDFAGGVAGSVTGTSLVDGPPVSWGAPVSIIQPVSLVPVLSAAGVQDITSTSAKLKATLTF